MPSDMICVLRESLAKQIHGIVNRGTASGRVRLPAEMPLKFLSVRLSTYNNRRRGGSLRIKFLIEQFYERCQKDSVLEKLQSLQAIFLCRRTCVSENVMAYTTGICLRKSTRI